MMFLEDFRSRSITPDMPIAMMMDTVKDERPPMMGSGIIDSTAPNLPNTPIRTNNTDMTILGVRLAFCKIQHEHDNS